MLTRNLYREDEVRAALIWCIVKRRTVEAAFWATELVEARLDPWPTLWTAWIYGIGVAGLGLIPLLLKAEEPVEIAIRLSCFQGRDASVMAILGSSVADRVGDPLMPPGFTGTPLEIYMVRAMIQGKAATVWSTVAGSEYPWPLWNQIMEFKHGRTVSLEIPCSASAITALATAIVCQRSLKLDVPPPTGVPSEVSRAVSEWSKLAGRRRRVFAPPVDCLARLTARGALDPYTSTEVEIMDTRLLKAACGTDCLEDSRFPDDIPDEWSSADRAKSHGRGVNAIDVRQFVQRWFGSMPCAAIWNGIARAQLLEGVGFDLKGPPPAPLPSFQPVRRVIDIPQRDQ